jgi:hypothetical protein
MCCDHSSAKMKKKMEGNQFNTSAQVIASCYTYSAKVYLLRYISCLGNDQMH